MRAMSKADRIRNHVRERHIEPARKAGVKLVSIRVGDIIKEMGLMDGESAVASALGTVKFKNLASVQEVGHKGPMLGANAIFTFQLLDIPSLDAKE
jgi:hypothetical protein